MFWEALPGTCLEDLSGARLEGPARPRTIADGPARRFSSLRLGGASGGQIVPPRFGGLCLGEAQADKSCPPRRNSDFRCPLSRRAAPSRGGRLPLVEGGSYSWRAVPSPGGRPPLEEGGSLSWRAAPLSWRAAPSRGGRPPLVGGGSLSWRAAPLSWRAAPSRGGRRGSRWGE